jgi:hypothetical protein
MLTVALALAVTEDKKTSPALLAGAVDCQVEPLEVNTFPEVLGATTWTADVPLPKTTLFAVRDVAPVPPLATGRVPVTPVVKGSPVAFVITPDAGVPKAGVTKVGEVNVPVALVSTRAEGVPKLGVVSTGEVRVLLVRV